MPGMGMVGRNFLSWHRQLLLVFEGRLQASDLLVAVPGLRRAQCRVRLSSLSLSLSRCWPPSPAAESSCLPAGVGIRGPVRRPRDRAAAWHGAESQECCSCASAAGDGAWKPAPGSGIDYGAAPNRLRATYRACHVGDATTIAELRAIHAARGIDLDELIQHNTLA